MCITTTVLKGSAIILKTHNRSPFRTKYNVERSKKLCLDGFNTIRGWGRVVQVALGYKFRVC